MKLALGTRCRDSVSGWEGFATARYEYLNGCVRYEISAADKDGKPEAFVFDEQQIEVVPGWRSTGSILSTQPIEAVGGPRDNRPVQR